MKKIVLCLFVLAVMVAAAILVIKDINRSSQDDLVIGGTYQSKTLSIDTRNIAPSVSFDGTNEYVVIENDPGSLYASVSVGDVVSFGSAGTIGGGLTEGSSYFVIQVVSNSKFKISDALGGTSVNLASGDGSNEMYLEMGERSGGEVKECTNYVISLDAEEAPSLAFKFQGSIQATEPEWYASQSLNNQWEYVDVYDVEDDAEVEGDTGITYLAGTDAHRTFWVSANAFNWLNIKSEKFASGSAIVRIKCNE